MFAFYRTPKAFFQSDEYKDLSAEAKILYGILLDRVSLSAMNEWKDEAGRVEWIKDIVKQKGLHVAIDGKAIKSARDKVNNGNVPYILSEFLCDIGLSIGQIKVDDKSNEITAIPVLLNLIDVKGKVINIDAIGTQEEIANKIVYEKKLLIF